MDKNNIDLNCLTTVHIQKFNTKYTKRTKGNGETTYGTKGQEGRITDKQNFSRLLLT